MIMLRLYRVMTQVAIEVTYTGAQASPETHALTLAPQLVGRVYRDPPGDVLDPYWLGEVLGDLLSDVECYEEIKVGSLL